MEVLERLNTRKEIVNKKIDKALTDGKSIEDLIRDLEQINVGISNAEFPKKTKIKTLSPIEQQVKVANVLIATLTSRSGEEVSLLEKVATIDRIKSENNVDILYLTTISQGGEIETSEAAFTQGRASYIGGVVVSYLLTSANGTYIDSRNISEIKKATFRRKKGVFYLETENDSSK